MDTKGAAIKAETCLGCMQSRSRKRSHRGLQKQASASLWSRCHSDMSKFGSSRVGISADEIQGMLGTTGLLQRHNTLCLMPCEPNKPVSAVNAALVSKKHRKYLLSIWMTLRDEAEYQRVMAMARDVAQILDIQA